MSDNWVDIIDPYNIDNALSAGDKNAPPTIIIINMILKELYTRTKPSKILILIVYRLLSVFL